MNGNIGGSTVWKGTAFSDCDLDEITLLHCRFGVVANTSAQCNNGHITLTGWSTRVENNSYYISQLEVMVEPASDNETMIIMKNVKCIHDHNRTEMVVGSMTINTSVTCMPSEILNDSSVTMTSDSLKGNANLNWYNANFWVQLGQLLLVSINRYSYLFE